MLDHVPGLLTRTIAAIVMPRKTSSETSRSLGDMRGFLSGSYLVDFVNPVKVSVPAQTLPGLARSRTLRNFATPPQAHDSSLATWTSPGRNARAHCRASRDDSPPAIAHDSSRATPTTLPSSRAVGCKSGCNNDAAGARARGRRDSDKHPNTHGSAFRRFGRAFRDDPNAAPRASWRGSSSRCGARADGYASNPPAQIQLANASGESFLRSASPRVETK